MGNIRQTFIKNISHDLLETYPNEFFIGDFLRNKLSVTNLTTVSSKLMRNRIAGYVTKIFSNSNKKRELVMDFEDYT